MVSEYDILLRDINKKAKWEDAGPLMDVLDKGHPTLIAEVSTIDLEAGDPVVMNADGSVTKVNYFADHEIGWSGLGPSSIFTLNVKALSVPNDVNDSFITAYTTTDYRLYLRSMYYNDDATWDYNYNTTLVRDNDITTITALDIIWLDGLDKFLLTWGDYNSGDGNWYPKVAIGSMSGLVPSMGAIYDIPFDDFPSVNSTSVVWDSSRQVAVFSSRVMNGTSGANGYIRTIACTISGTTPTFGADYLVSDGVVNTMHTSLVHDPNTDKFIHTYYNANNDYITQATTISGTTDFIVENSTDLGVNYTGSGATNKILTIYDPSIQKTLAFVVGGDTETLETVTVDTNTTTPVVSSSTTIDSSTAASSIYPHSVQYDTLNNKPMLFYGWRDLNISPFYEGRINKISMSGNVASSFDNYKLLKHDYNFNGANPASMCFSDFSERANFVYDHTGSASSQFATWKIDPLGTNLKLYNYMGIAQENKVVGEQCLIGLEGFIDYNQTGLTPGRNYYVTNSGTITLEDVGGSPFGGQAITASGIIVKGYDDTFKTWVVEQIDIAQESADLDYWAESRDTINKVTKFTPVDDDSGLVFGSTTNTITEATNGYDVIVAGYSNTVTSGTSEPNYGYSFIGSGAENQIKGGTGAASILGGWQNVIDSWGWAEAIVGGQGNLIEETSEATFYSFIGGGENNYISGEYGFIGGGAWNDVRGLYSTIAGGDGNEATSYATFIGGGNANQCKQYASSVVGGEGNSILGGSGEYSVHKSFIGGGDYNAIYALNSTTGRDMFIGGGSYNKITDSPYSSIVGGGNSNPLFGNEIYEAQGSFIGGGEGNTTISGVFLTIVGGKDNIIDYTQIGTNKDPSFIGGGRGNQIYNEATVIYGGTYNYSNFNSGSWGWDFIGGGYDNVITGGGENIIVGGGFNNISDTDGYDGIIVGGYQNNIFPNNGEATAEYSVIVGGDDNFSGSYYNFIGSGAGNYINGSATGSGGYSVITGGIANTINGGFGSTIVGGELNEINNNYCTIVGGRVSEANNYGQIVFGGGVQQNTQSSKYILNCGVTASWSELTLTGTAFAAATRSAIQLEDSQVLVFEGTVVVKEDTGANYAAWKVEGLIRREVGAATTVLEAHTKTLIHKSESTWDLQLSADTTYGYLKIEAKAHTGVTNLVRAAATIDTTEFLL
jgi:hypothetical protein